jgi:hypothetical protein
LSPATNKSVHWHYEIHLSISYSTHQKNWELGPEEIPLTEP